MNQRNRVYNQLIIKEPRYCGMNISDNPYYDH